MSYSSCPTVVIFRDGNPVRINESDYDPVVDGECQPDIFSPVAEPVAEPVALGLLKKGRKYFVVNQTTSEAVEMDGIDPEGYSTEAAAIEAVQAVLAA